MRDRLREKYDYDISIPNSLNKLYCTFTEPNNLDYTINNIMDNYTILYDKIFVLESDNKDEYIITYNLDGNNISKIPEQTINVHRKKITNTLYTINALNKYIVLNNNGISSKSFDVDWYSLKNTILLTQKNDLKMLKTKIKTIVSTR